MIADFVKEKPEHEELQSILRSCVHCGFCNAVCPTYQLLGDELDGPRGRIYLLKQALQGEPVSKLTQKHLDRCLTCQSCETTCPSGVRYSRLLNIGRTIVDEKAGRTLPERLTRGALKTIFPYQHRFHAFVTVAGLFKLFLPAQLKSKIPVRRVAPAWPNSGHSRIMLILSGCVQQTLAPSIDVAAAKVLDKLGIALRKVQGSGCCGALTYHLSDHQQALRFARRNIDACWPYLEQGAEAIVMTASGCGLMVKDYAELFKHDAAYAVKAVRFSALVKDISEVIAAENFSVFKADNRKIAFQSPCTLQHGQKLAGVVETILQTVGYQLTMVADGHICCGSAGTYSLLQPALSKQLLDNKLQALQANQPDIIATANIGCLSHLQSASSTKIVHWLELLQDE
ncbi:MAG: glycolate oxidase subunit GlcF [Methylococcaceae bacterium]